MAAQDAELKLKVSLDLAFFRQQLAGLGQAAAGYNLPLNVKLDRSVLTKELRNLERAVGKKKINVELNILGGLTGKQLTAIQDRLEALSKTRKVEVPVSVKNGATGQDVSKTIASIKERIGNNQQIKQGGGKLRVPLSVKPSITNADVADFKRAIREKFSGISVKIKADIEGGGRSFAAGPTGLAGLQEYMRTQGLSGGNAPGATETGRRAQFENAVNKATSKELAKMMQTVDIAGRSKLTKVAQMREALLKINDVAMEKILGNLKMQMQGPLPIKRNFLDQVARAVFWMAGVDPAYLRQQAAQRRALPFVDFPSTVPQRNISIGPSSSGRALPQGVIPGALPGTAFRQQKYLPTDLGLETKEILRDAAYAFLDAIKQGVRTVNVQDLGTAPSRQPLLGAGRVAGLLPGRAAQTNVLELNNILAGAIREYFKAIAAEIRKGPQGATIAQSFALPAGRQIAGLLPPAGGTTPRGQMRFNAVSAGAVLGQPSFMRAPSIPRAAGGGIPPVPPVPPGGGGGGGMGGFGRAMGGINLPGAGTIRELGSEFAFATKQVLLFGQAYKLLGFIQAFPGQVGQAVAQLQSFRNTLDAVSPTAEEAAASNRLILDLVEKYNVPLQSARDGFTKLYASMAPAGFKGDEVRELFTGITKAAATFGMSADKVDRVNYAFAQMASKGQVMSEELKGQLGDVLPGAMALFAKAAGFEGPKAIQDFSAALEDGRYKGEAMVALLKNVGIVMNKEFGPGAEGAALTFQGIINRMQNSMRLLYESFEPVAVEFLNAVVVPLTDGIKQLSDGFTAFFSGSAAKTAGGFAIAQELERLKPAFDGIRTNAAQLGQVFAQFGKIALDVAKVLLQIAGNPVVGYLAKLYAIALPLNMALGVLRGLWISNAVQLLVFNARIATGTSLLTAFRGVMAATGATAATTAASIRTAGLTMRTFFATTGIGLVVAGISILIERFMTMNQRLEETREKALGAAQAIRAMSSTEARTEEFGRQRTIRDLQQLQKSKDFYNLGKERFIQIPGEMAQRFERQGVPVKKDLIGRPLMDPAMIPAYIMQQQQLMGEAGYRQRQLQFEETQALQPVQLGAIPPSEGKPTEEKGKTKSLEDLIGGDIERKLNEAKAALRELVAKRLGEAAGDQDAERMIKYFEKYREITLEIQAINETIRKVEGEMPALIKLGIDPAEKIAELRSKEIVLLYDLQTAVQEQTNEAKKAADERAKQLRDYEETINNIRIENGLVSAEQAVQIKLAQQYQKIIEQFPFLREEEKKQVKALLADNQKQLRTVREEIELLRAVSDIEQRRIELRREGYSNQRIQEILDLEKIRDNIKAVRELIDSFVTDTTSDYKNFLGEIISGKDAGDALREFQKSLKDRVLKIFLDFSMAPVEKFFKESLNQFALDKLFPKADIEKIPEETKKETALEANTAALNRLTDTITTPAVSPAPPQGPVPQARPLGDGYWELPVIPSPAGPASSQGQGVGNDLANMLMQQNGYEDIAGLKPLPLQRMLQQIGRPFTVLYQQIEEAAQSVFPYSRREVRRMLAPSPQRTQRVLNRAEAVERTRRGWDPLEAEWKERQNRTNPNPRSRTVPASLSTFESVVRTVSHDAFTRLNKMSGLYGILGDISDYLTENERSILRKGIAEQLNQGVNPNRLPTGGNINTGRANVRQAIRELTDELLQEKKKWDLPSFMDPPQIIPGVQDSFEGVMLPGSSFDISKMGQSYGEIAAAGESLQGILDNMSTYVSGIETSSNTLNSSLASIDQSVMAAGENIAPTGPTGQKWQQSLGAAVQGIGIAAGSIMGIMAGIQQVKEGGTSNVLGGIGSILLSVGGAIGGLSSLGGLFGGGGGAGATMGGANYFNPKTGLGVAGPNFGLAKGGIMHGGFTPFRAFANGGVVTGPTLGLVGEGRFSEAVVPLPDGKSIPVQLGGRTARDLMGGNAPGMPQQTSLNMSFETTKINGVEYVSRDQLEQAMAETRRASISGGARQGMAMTLDKIRQSPSTRSRIGMR